MKSNYILAFLCILGMHLNAQVGINTTSPKTTLDINGALSLREGVALTLTDINDTISLGTDTYSSYRIVGPTTSFTIRGIVQKAGSDGQVLTLVNTTPFTMQIEHNNSVVSTNGILCPGERTMNLAGANTSVTLQYNTTEQRWTILSYADNRYGDNIQSVKGTADTSTNSNAFADMADMRITFTPNHSTVYVNFGAAGAMDLSSASPRGAFGLFRLVNETSGTVLGGSATMAVDYSVSTSGSIRVGSAWNSFINMFPVQVTPGVPVTLKIQWARSGPSVLTALQNNVSTNSDFSHRNLTIFD